MTYSIFLEHFSKRSPTFLSFVVQYHRLMSWNLSDFFYQRQDCMRIWNPSSVVVSSSNHQKLVCLHEVVFAVVLLCFSHKHLHTSMLKETYTNTWHGIHAQILAHAKYYFLATHTTSPCTSHIKIIAFLRHTWQDRYQVSYTNIKQLEITLPCIIGNMPCIKLRVWW